MKIKINQKKLQAYRKSHVSEIFYTKEATYDIVVAQFLIDQNPRAVEIVSVDELAMQCGFDHRPVKEEDGYLFFQCPHSSSKVVIDQEHFQDLDKPIIFADGQLIDGHQRKRKRAK